MYYKMPIYYIYIYIYIYSNTNNINATKHSFFGWCNPRPAVEMTVGPAEWPVFSIFS